MSLEFANPWMLWGSALAAVPLIIHLFNRRRARPHPFAAIDFVLRSRRRTARRLRLKRLLLFLVRTLFLLALPIALARPQQKREDVAAAPQGPAATVIVLDTSLSMGYRLPGGSATLFERAQGMARDALASLAPEDPATLVTCEADGPPPTPPGFERGAVREAFDRATLTYEPQDMTACFARAARALAESPLPSKRLILATDLTAAAFRLDVPAPTIATSQGEVRPEVVLLDAAGGAKELPNAAISQLRVEAAPAIGHRAYQFTATVTNHSSSPLKDATALLRVGKDVVAKGFVDVPARGTAVKTLSYRFPAGGVFQGAMELGHDSLEADDVRHFALRVPRDIKALVVDGEPNPVRFLDEAFFVETALGSPGSPARPTVRDAEAAAQEDFAEYDVFLLLNVRELPAAKVLQLRERVLQGAGLLVSLGDQVDGEAYNALFGDLLVRPLHLVKTAADRKEEGAEKRAARLAHVAFDHPAFSVFTGEGREGMLAARTYRYFLLAPGDASQVTTLASYDDGAPALLEARRGKGRVVLYTSSVDRSWTDWPIRTSFLPAMQRLTGWISGALDEKGLEQALVGEAKALEPAPGTTDLKVLGPDDQELRLATSTEGKAVTSGPRAPGIYRVSGSRAGAAAAPLPELTFAVNVHPRESDLARLDETELKSYFGERTTTRKGGGQDEVPPPLPLWSMLLALAAGLLLSEGLLLRS
ncbi:MAG: BatA domain-containing protein [Deltaproteobacteria bacterium]|nr:BatA domain-containing protein [Deltaproteobacteria bacterium]